MVETKSLNVALSKELSIKALNIHILLVLFVHVLYRKIQKEIESVLNLFGMENQKKLREIHKIYQTCFDKLDETGAGQISSLLTFCNIRKPISWGNKYIDNI